MQNLYTYFGWQGGTIHQVADVTGCDSGDLIYKEYVCEEDFTDHYQYVAGLGWNNFDLKTRLILKQQWFGCINYCFGVS